MQPLFSKWDISVLSSTKIHLKRLQPRNRDSSPTGQFTDTHFEDSSPTELKTVHRQN